MLIMLVVLIASTEKNEATGLENTDMVFVLLMAWLIIGWCLMFVLDLVRRD